MCDMGITSQSSAVYAQHDELTAGYLDGAGGHRGREPFRIGGDDYRNALESQAHAIAARTDAEPANRPERVLEPRNPTDVWTIDHAERLGIRGLPNRPDRPSPQRGSAVGRQDIAGPEARFRRATAEADAASAIRL